MTQAEREALQNYVQLIVTAAPPLTGEQRRELLAIFRGLSHAA